jgi:hypothetical protein
MLLCLGGSPNAFSQSAPKWQKNQHLHFEAACIYSKDSHAQEDQFTDIHGQGEGRNMKGFETSYFGADQIVSSQNFFPAETSEIQGTISIRQPAWLEPARKPAWFYTPYGSLQGSSTSLMEPKSVWGIPRSFPGSQRKISGM